jgi:hypothetical protein
MTRARVTCGPLLPRGRLVWVGLREASPSQTGRRAGAQLRRPWPCQVRGATPATPANPVATAPATAQTAASRQARFQPGTDHPTAAVPITPARSRPQPGTGSKLTAGLCRARPNHHIEPAKPPPHHRDRAAAARSPLNRRRTAGCNAPRPSPPPQHRDQATAATPRPSCRPTTEDKPPGPPLRLPATGVHSAVTPLRAKPPRTARGRVPSTPPPQPTAAGARPVPRPPIRRPPHAPKDPGRSTGQCGHRRPLAQPGRFSPHS